MFASIKPALLSKIKKLGIKSQVRSVDDCRKIERLVNEKIGPAFNVKVLKYKNGTAYIKTGNFQLSNEIKLLERSIKRELREEDINLNEIRLV